MVIHVPKTIASGFNQVLLDSDNSSIDTSSNSPQMNRIVSISQDDNSTTIALKYYHDFRTIELRASQVTVLEFESTLTLAIATIAMGTAIVYVRWLLQNKIAKGD
jgi:hypothetical protein